MSSGDATKGESPLTAAEAGVSAAARPPSTVLVDVGDPRASDDRGVKLSAGMASDTRDSVGASACGCSAAGDSAAVDCVVGENSKLSAMDGCLAPVGVVPTSVLALGSAETAVKDEVVFDEDSSAAHQTTDTDVVGTR